MSLEIKNEGDICDDKEKDNCDKCLISNDW